MTLEYTSGSKIPERFLSTPSNAKGISIQQFLSDNQHINQYLNDSVKTRNFHPILSCNITEFVGYLTEQRSLPERFIKSGLQLYRSHPGHPYIDEQQIRENE